MPEQFANAILNFCSKNNGVRVVVCTEQGYPSATGLDFASDGFSKTLEHRVSIITYINNLLKFSRHSFSLKLNDTNLLDIPLLPRLEWEGYASAI